MTNCVIRPIPLIEMEIDKSMLTYRLSFGESFKQVVYAWYIEGPKEKMIVDTGISAEYLIQKRGFPARNLQSLESGLNRVGLSPADIDLVILTHLHSDHVGQGGKFTKAKFIVQKDELEFAQNPHPTVAMQYLGELFDGLNFEVVEGDTPICDEVSVISTPGHTPGGQSVTVKTAEGTAIISGLCTIRENFDPPEPFSKTMPVYPIGLFVDLFKMYDNLLKIKNAADIIISNHDPEYVQREHIP
jgi:N-acyl homoserine lactone hydrolase